MQGNAENATARSSIHAASALLPHHAQMIMDSAIAAGVATERGYFTATETIHLRGFGWHRSRTLSRLLPALVIPVRGVLDSGAVSHALVRPDNPRSRKGKLVKYEAPLGARNVLDVPPRVRHDLGDPSVPLWVVEGAKKADALVSAGECAVSISGVWNWRGRNGRSGLTAVPDWEEIALNGREVRIGFDSDISRNQAVAKAARRLGDYLSAKGARVRYLILPDDGAHKIGVDDFLARRTG